MYLHYSTLLAAALTLPAINSARADVLYVDDSAPRLGAVGGDGSSWSAALPFLQDALTIAAASNGVITEIRVAQGTYKPDRIAEQPEGTRDRDAAFALQNNLSIIGGFRGAFTGRLLNGRSADDRDVEQFASVLHGDLAGDDGPEGTFLNSQENTYQLVRAIDVGPSAVIDGFVVTSGRSDGVAMGASPQSRDQGTAVNVYFASPMILNCTFRNNWTKNHGTINDHGGSHGKHGHDEAGIAGGDGDGDDHSGGSTIINCVFRGNYSARFGSGLYIHNDTATLAMGCRFLDNEAADEGGGVYSNSAGHHTAVGFSLVGFRSWLLAHGSWPTVASQQPAAKSQESMAASLPMHAMVMNCEIRGNKATRGAGIWTASNSTLHVMDCVVADNEAEFGGGMYNDLTEPWVTGCEFEGNSAQIGGGAIFNNFARATIEDCTFTANDAGLEVQGGGGGGGGSGGGGVWNSGEQPMIRSCVFEGNEASFGAGVYNIDGSLAVIDSCHFTNNRASEGAGLYSIGDSDAVAVNCMFQNNLVTGGSFAVGGGASSYFSNVTFDRCCFANNSAFLGGGGMYIEGGNNNRVLNCLFLDNHTTGTFSGWGGGILNSFGAHVTVVNSLFAGNSAQRGGAFHNTVFTSASLINCTMTDNVATGQFGDFGGGIYANSDTSTSVANCIVWNNSPDQVDVMSETSFMDVRYCNVQGGFAGDGNIASPPQFADVDGPDNDAQTYVDNDYRPAVTSPCIDAGDTNALPVEVTRDLDYAQRLVDISSVRDTGVPAWENGPVVDMGAYEVQPIPFCPADIAPVGWPDGMVNIDDLLVVIQMWNATGSPGSVQGDLTGDGIVNIDDLLLLIAAWGPCSQ